MLVETLNIHDLPSRALKKQFALAAVDDHKPMIDYEILVNNARQGHDRFELNNINVHSVVEFVNHELVISEFRFTHPRRWNNYTNRAELIVNIHKPGKCLSVICSTDAAGIFDALVNKGTPVLYADPENQQIFHELVTQLVNVSTRNGADFFQMGDSLERNTDLVGFQARTVVVNDVSFGVFDDRNKTCPFTNTLIVLDDVRENISGRTLYKLARQARLELYPELSKLKTIDDVVNYVNDYNCGARDVTEVEYADAESAVITVDWGTVNVVMLDGEPLAITRHSENKVLVTNNERVMRSVNSFNSTIFKDARGRIETVKSLTL